jgi:NADH-quinone oxidoreductase subunit E
MFSPELRTKAEELVGRYPGSRSALLPLLHLVQHQDGYITDDGVAECAELLGLTKAEVGAVATFYTMYKREALGRHLVSVCTNFACKVRGAQEVYDRLSAKLGVGHNGTTDDRTFTLEHAECLGNCEGAPVVTVDYMNYECLSADQAEELLDRIVAGETVPPTRGFVPPGVREVSHRLAGLGPLDPDAPGERLGLARADDGGVPVPEAGPGGDQRTIDVAMAPEWEEGRREGALDREQDREAAEDEVADAGFDPDAVADAAGDKAREFPTVKPDADFAQQTGEVREEDQVASDRDAQVVEPGESVRKDQVEQVEQAEQAEAQDEEPTDG